MRHSFLSTLYIVQRSSFLLIGVILLLFVGNVNGQHVPATDGQQIELLRLRQLVDPDYGVSNNLSTVISYEGHFKKDSSILSLAPTRLNRDNSPLDLRVLPLAVRQVFNSGNPYLWEDGLFLPAKGYQSLISAGISAKYGPLRIKLRPEFLYASNPYSYSKSDENAIGRYSIFAGRFADLPYYLWRENYSALSFGQSSVKLTFDPISIGISSENIKWGPGKRNSLVMSSNARGFNHVSLNTSKPLKTWIGKFEGQLIAAKLEQSDDILNTSKPEGWRYLSGMAFNYQPKWMPELSVGLTRVFQMNNNDLEAEDYFPLFQAFLKNGTDEESKKRDQLSSVYARYIFRNAKAEIYAEFARNDHNVDLRDLVMEPQHSRAYLVGFQKMVSLSPRSENLLLAAEITQLSQAPSRHVRDAGAFYWHWLVTQGYTHKGEVIGASIGPGGNMQTLEFSWIKGVRKLGFELERFVHNNDYYQFLSQGNNTYNGQWIDVSAAILGRWDFKNLVFDGRLMGIQSYNYLWQSGYYGTDQAKNLFNVHANVGISYYFNSSVRK